VFLYAGHGTMTEDTTEQRGEFHLVPYDVTRITGESGLRQLEEKGVSASWLRDRMGEIAAQKQVMMLDSCHSGGAIVSFARGPAEEVAIAQLARATGMMILASSSEDELSRSSQQLGHGFFTYSVLEGLRGKADFNGDRRVTVKELNFYIDDRLPQLTVEQGKPPQFPHSYYRGSDFPIAILDGSQAP
ncbi:MAG: caspase family protein, partial [Verrucomicrobiota bacterium]